MKRRLKVAVTGAVVAVVLGVAPAMAGASSPWSYGPRGSCYDFVNGHWYPGYVEYFHGRLDGRCVLQ